MPKLNTQLRLNNQAFTNTKIYNEQVDVQQEVDSTDGFIELLNFSTTKGTNTQTNSKGLCVYNMSNVCAEIQFKTTEWKNDSNTDIGNSVDLGPGSATTTRNETFLLPAQGFMYLDNSRFLSYAEDASAANATTIDNTAPDSNMYTDSTADTDDTTATDNVDNSASNTTVYLEPYTSATNCTANLFKVGDLIRIRDEIMEVTAIGDKSDLANNTLTVKRGMFGSTATTNTDDEDAVRFAFFNTHNKFNAYSTAQTDKQGMFSATNFFGYGRSLTAVADGIVPGSIAIKFYEQGYQELGLEGITSNTPTGLAASTTYQFTIAVDGGSAYDIDLTTDSTNLNFGGPNGFISKLQAIFNTQFHTTSSNLFEKKVTVGIVNGDIRFTSGSRLSTSGIVLADSSGSDTDIWGVGRFPAVANVEGAVNAKLPEDVIYDDATNKELPNTSAFLFDNGNGELLGTPGNGTINYETGAIQFRAHEEANFVVSFKHKSAHSGGVDTTADQYNNLISVSARSCNDKLPAKIKLISYT